MIRVNGAERPWREGLTISDLLSELDDSYQYPVVRLNDERISRPLFEQTFVPDNSDIFLISLVAGG